MSTRKNDQPENYKEEKSYDPGINKDRGLNEDEQRKITNQEDAEEESEFYIDGSGEVVRKNPYKRKDDKKEIENLENPQLESFT
jgi:hypothetical protein